MTREEKTIWQRAYVAKNRAAINARRRERYHANHVVELGKIKQWRAENPEKLKAISKRNWEQHRPEGLARQRAYYHANREALLAQKKAAYEGRAREFYQHRLKLWEAKPELRERALARIERWKKKNPKLMDLYNAKRLLSIQTGIPFGELSDEVAEAKMVQLHIHRWVKAMPPTPEAIAVSDTPAARLIWQPIETAIGKPIMNQRVRIRTAKGREFDAKCGYFACDEAGYDVPAWAAWNQEDAPECWTDGVCWTVNEAGVESDQPTHWQPAARLKGNV